MGDATDTLSTLVIIGIVIFLLFMFWGQSFLSFAPHWTVDISASPANSGSVSPLGDVSVKQGTPLIVNATSTADWAFSNWVFDNRSMGTSPSLALPAQDVNSTHTLVATFIGKTALLSITPNPMSFTVNSSSKFNLVLHNSGNFDASELQVRLNDPYHIFTTFPLLTGESYDGYFVYIFYTDVVNKWVTLRDRDYYGYTLNLPANGTYTQAVGGNTGGYGGGSVSCQVGAPAAGTYTLTWDITFIVTNGVNAPPKITVPWTVTMLD
jgi:hypothetical protein